MIIWLGLVSIFCYFHQLAFYFYVYAFEPQPSHVVEVTYCKITWRNLDKLSISSKLSRKLLFRFCRRRRHRMLRSLKLLLPTTKLKRHSRHSRRSSTRSSNFCTIRGFHPEIQKQVRALNNSNFVLFECL